MASSTGPVEVLRTPYGRWDWWEFLQVVSYVPKGNRRPTEEVSLSVIKNNLDNAIVAAARGELRRAKVRP